MISFTKVPERHSTVRQTAARECDRWGQVDKMETIELKPRPLHLTRVLLLLFISCSIMEYMLYGWYEASDVFFFSRARLIGGAVAIAMVSLGFAIPFFQGRFNICLTGTTLRAPVRKRIFLFPESTIFDVSEISVNRSWRDRLIGTQIVTTDGEPLQIYSCFYGHRSILKLLDAIESRQKYKNSK